MSQQLTRQQIYDRIRATSKDSYILEEMQRLGFWENSEIPTLPEQLIRQEATLTQELNQLLEKDRRYQNQELLLREIRKERMKKAKENRELTKQKNKQKKLEKAVRWKQMQLGQLFYLGKEISAGLNNTDCDTALLQQLNLPVFNTLVELTEQSGYDLLSLRYLLYNRKVSKSCHYYTFEIPKKSGGKRKISAPKKKLKVLQNWVLEAILSKIPVGEYAHGFIKERSILSNAQPHIGKDIVINVDLKDFFPTISYKRVKGLFRKLGYSEQLSIIFALICTQAETDIVEMDGVTYHVQKNNRFLPQGSPASPAISNLIAFKLDKRVQGLAKAFNFTYSRYADDLTFSTTKENEKNIARFLFYLKEIIQSEGFTMHPAKTHIMRKGGLQKVTGIVVNEKQNVERVQLRKFRALLHNIEVNGWKNQQWGHSESLARSIEGYINFVKMVNPEKGIKFREQFDRILEKYGCPPEPEPRYTSTPIISVEEKDSVVKEETVSLPEKSPKKPEQNKPVDWWNIFS